MWQRHPAAVLQRLEASATLFKHTGMGPVLNLSFKDNLVKEKIVFFVPGSGLAWLGYISLAIIFF